MDPLPSDKFAVNIEYIPFFVLLRVVYGSGDDKVLVRVNFGMENTLKNTTCFLKLYKR